MIIGEKDTLIRNFLEDCVTHYSAVVSVLKYHDHHLIKIFAFNRRDHGGISDGSETREDDGGELEFHGGSSIAIAVESGEKEPIL